MTVKAVPEGFHTLTPYLSVRDAVELIEFLKKAFGARETYVVKYPDGTLLSGEVEVGDSKLLIGEADNEDPSYQAIAANLYMYVPNVDEVYKRAIEAGAKSVQNPQDQFWGDRTAIVKDVAGNRWWIASHMEDMSSEELLRRATEAE